MYYNDFKEACRLYWMVKGHLRVSREQIKDSAPGYFKRLWCQYQGEDTSFLLEGFEEAFNKYEHEDSRKKSESD